MKVTKADKKINLSKTRSVTFRVLSKTWLLLIFLLLPVFSLWTACSSASKVPLTAPTPLDLESLESKKTRPYPVIQGLTNQAATQIAVLLPKDGRFKFQAATPDGKILEPDSIRFIQVESSETKVAQIEFHFLKPGLQYELHIYDESSPSAPQDRRQFSALDLNSRSSNNPAKVIFASCLYDLFLSESRVMWKAVRNAEPDLLLLIGDNVYAEIANGRFPSPLNEAALWTRYVETFQALDFFHFEKLIPTLATWDDHDYGMKDGDQTNPHKLESKKVFETFFPQKSSPIFRELKTGPGVSRRWLGFGYAFYLLDNRFFRGEEDSEKAPTHFGIEQEKWLASGLQKDKRPSFLISGDQWFGAYHRFESYEGRHAKSLNHFFSRVRDSKPGPLALVSGDRHLTEISKIESSWLGFETYELTSSALHSRAHPSRWDVSPNPRQVAGIDLKHSFMLLRLTAPRPKEFQLRGAAIGADSEVLIPIELDIRSGRSRQKSEP